MRTKRRNLRQYRALRRGATLAETAFVLIVFLLLVLGMLDLGIMVTRRQALAQAARSGARAAIVRGKFAERLGPLGPSELTCTASDSNAVATAVRSQLVMMNPADVRVQVAWSESSNELNEPVRVTVAADFTPVMTFLFGSPTWTLTGSSEMQIAH